MVFNVCVLLEFVERLYAGIDGFNVLTKRLCAEMDGFQCVYSAGIY
jgi:hypothetical protein